jgi:hypothetical protein
MRPPRSWWAPLASERVFYLQLMRAGRALRRARLAAYKSVRRGRGGFLPLHSAFAVSAPCSSAPEPFLPLHLRSWSCSILQFFVPPPARMAPQQPLTIIDPPSWERLTATMLALGQLVAGGQLAANVDGQPPEWIMSSENERVPNPPYGYIVCFMRFHERGFTAPASRFLRGLCYHYGVELQNFAPNAISQAATFVGVCEGFLGIPVNWDLWVHLFGTELHTLPTLEPRTRRAARTGSFGARSAELAQGGVHPLHDDLQQLGLGAGVVLPPQRRPRPPPTPARCSGRGPPPGTMGCLRPRTRRGWTRSWPR